MPPVTNQNTHNTNDRMKEICPEYTHGNLAATELKWGQKMVLNSLNNYINVKLTCAQSK